MAKLVNIEKFRVVQRTAEQTIGCRNFSWSTRNASSSERITIEAFSTCVCLYGVCGDALYLHFSSLLFLQLHHFVRPVPITVASTSFQRCYSITMVIVYRSPVQYFQHKQIILYIRGNREKTVYEQQQQPSKINELKMSDFAKRVSSGTKSLNKRRAREWKRNISYYIKCNGS